MLGPKGGTGKTLTATSLAVALAEMGKRVALVDLDLQFGDVGLCMGLRPERTVYDLVRAGGSLDEEKLGDFLVTHHSGVEVLIAPSRPDHAASVGIEFLREVYSVLRRMVDYVIVDTPPGFTPEVIATIDSATAICMVGMLDALSLKNTKLGLETLDLMGVPRDRIKLVLNRARTRVGISDDDVVAIIDRTPDISCPLLGFFGNDDQFPTPQQVDDIEKALIEAGKDYEFHRYDGAGHAFFGPDRPAYRVEAALEGWDHIWRFLGAHLRG